MPGRLAAMLAHVSIQCADFDRSAAFYDAVLAPLGGRRVMEVDDAIGYGVPPAANVLDRPPADRRRLP